MPAYYTAESLAAWLHENVTRARLDQYLEWNAQDSYSSVVDDASISLGITNLPGYSDVGKLRAVAKVYLWRQIVEALTTEFNFSADGGTYSRQALYDQAVKTLGIVESEAAQVGALPGWKVTIGRVKPPTSPYDADRRWVETVQELSDDA